MEMEAVRRADRRDQLLTLARGLALARTALNMRG